MGSLRLTKKGQSYLLEHDRGRIGKIEDKIKYSKSEEEKRRRLHRIASTYISMRNSGVKIYKDQKPVVFSKNKVDEVEIKEPVFYSSLEIKSVGIECTKIKYCRAVELLLASNDRGFIIYNSQNTLMKWSSTAEQRVAGTLTGLLLDCGIQINHFYGLMIGKNMEFAKRLLLSDGGLLQLIGWKLLGALITLCTFGICYPWAFCMVYSWEAKHTVINGKRLQFNGTAVGLFGNWIKWLLLTFITCGIYSFWLVIALKKWKIKHTEFVK